MTQASTPEEQLSAYLDGELSGAERAEVERLLESDAELRRLRDDLLRMRGLLHSLPRVAPQVDLRDGVSRAIERRALTPRREATPAERIRRRVQWRRGWPTWTVVAVTAAASVSLTLIVVQQFGGPGRPGAADRAVAVLDVEGSERDATEPESLEAAATFADEVSHVEEESASAGAPAAPPGEANAPAMAAAQKAEIPSGPPQPNQLAQSSERRSASGTVLAEHLNFDVAQLERQLEATGEVELVWAGNEATVGQLLTQLASDTPATDRQLALGRSAAAGNKGAGRGPSQAETTPTDAAEGLDRQPRSPALKPGAASDKAVHQEVAESKTAVERIQRELELTRDNIPVIVVRGSREEIQRKVQWLLQQSPTTVGAVRLGWTDSRPAAQRRRTTGGEKQLPEAEGRAQPEAAPQAGLGGFGGGGAGGFPAPSRKRKESGTGGVRGGEKNTDDAPADRSDPDPHAAADRQHFRAQTSFLRLRFVVDEPEADSKPADKRPVSKAPKRRSDRAAPQSRDHQPPRKDTSSGQSDRQGGH